MIIYISLVVGIIIGIRSKLPKKFEEINNKITFIGVFILLFLMGVSLGINKEVLTNLKMVGISGFLFALFPVIFSVITVYYISTIFLKGDRK